MDTSTDILTPTTRGIGFDSPIIGGLGTRSAVSKAVPLWHVSEML